MRRLIIVALVAFLLLPAIASAQDHGYWLIGPGHMKVFENEDNPEDLVVLTSEGLLFGASIYRSKWTISETVVEDWCRLYTGGGYGGILCHGCYSPETRYSIPPHLALHAPPLAVGLSWESWFEWDGEIAALIGEVQAEEDVTVPLGDYHCFVVQTRMFCDAEWTCNLKAWRADGTGLVKFESDGTLAGYGNGIYVLTEMGVVPVAEASWSDVKKLYR